MTAQAKTPYFLILALWLAGLLAGAQFAKFSVLFPQLRGIYPDASTSLGFLVSVLSLLGMIFGVIAGMFVSRIGYRRSLLVALALGVAVSLFQSTLPGFSAMMVSRIIEGLSHLIIVVAAPTLIAQVSSDRDRPVVMTLWSTFFGVAFALMNWVGLPFVSAWGETALFMAHAACLAAIAMTLLFILPSQRGAIARHEPVPLGEIILIHVRVYASARTAAPAIGWLFYTLTFASLLTLLPETLPAQSRIAVSGAMPVSSIIASLTVGIIMLKFLPAVTVIMTGFALSLVFAIALAALPGNAFFCLALMASMGLIQSASFAAVPQLNDALEHRALANGAIAQTGNTGNLLGTPVLLFALTSAGYGTMMGLVAILFGCGIAAHMALAAARRRENNMPAGL